MAATDLTEINKLVSEIARKDGGEEKDRLGSAVELIRQRFRVQAHEIAVLCLTKNEKALRFLAPLALREVGEIPLSSGSALAARTVRERRPEIVNHFMNISHASVFEGVPINESQRGEPIQKIMSSPVMQSGKPIGVLQVSRKAKSLAEAGPDFTYTDLRELKSISDALAATILGCMDEPTGTQS